jgi:sulfotransferase family protein
MNRSRPKPTPADAERLVRRPWEAIDEAYDYHQLCRVRLEHVVEVREPMVLISQIQRSGGTLLSRLFDGHPECHAHPYELQGPIEDGWPKVDLAAPETWFASLYEKKVAEHLTSGYSKPGLKAVDLDVFPFVFLPRLQKRLFDQCIAARQIERERDVFDCYFTSYFNAWLDNHNLYTGPKKAVTAFTPLAMSNAADAERFFAAYPDGIVISIVREPRAWYASAARHKKRYADLGDSIGLWRQSAEGALEARRKLGKRVVVLTYDQLVREPEAAMRRLAERIGITMSPILLTPTFNGRPVRPNSSDAVDSYGVVADRTDAYRDVLDADAIGRIDELAGEIYIQAVEESRTA